MTLHEQWQEQMEAQSETPGGSEFFNRYLEQEKVAYKHILGEKKFVLEGTLGELAAELGMDMVTFTGFLDGANTSFVQEVALEGLEESSPLKLELVPPTLYYNMLMVKANWLYDLPEWNDILGVDERRDIRMKYNQNTRATSEKVGRNDPCPCGSGKKYKKCCGANA